MTKGINTENKKFEDSLKILKENSENILNDIRKENDREERNLIHEKGIEDIRLERSKNDGRVLIMIFSLFAFCILSGIILHGIFTEHQNIRADCNIVNDESFNITKNSNKTYIPKGTLNCKFDAQMSIISYLAMR